MSLQCTSKTSKDVRCKNPASARSSQCRIHSTLSFLPYDIANMVLESKRVQEHDECHPDGLQFKKKDTIIQDLLHTVKEAEREWRLDMGNQDPDVNEFDELVVVRLLLHDSHFFDQNVRREYGEKLLAQWDKGLLCQQAQTIRDLVNGDKRKLYTFHDALDRFIDPELQHDNSTRFKL